MEEDTFYQRFNLPKDIKVGEFFSMVPYILNCLSCSGLFLSQSVIAWNCNVDHGSSCVGFTSFYPDCFSIQRKGVTAFTVYQCLVGLYLFLLEGISTEISCVLRRSPGLVSGSNFSSIVLVLEARAGVQLLVHLNSKKIIQVPFSLWKQSSAVASPATLYIAWFFVFSFRHATVSST